MKKNNYSIVISIAFFVHIWGITEDKDVQSVIPTQKIQKRANADSGCVAYVDNNYYLYEGEAALFDPRMVVPVQGAWNSTLVTYDPQIVRVYEVQQCQFDGNSSLGGYYYSHQEPLAALLLEGIKTGKTQVSIKINRNQAITIPLVVLDNSDDHLEKMDKQNFFEAIKNGDFIKFKILLQRGVSLDLVNENQENIITALSKNLHINLIRYLVEHLHRTNNHSKMIELLTSLIMAKHDWAAAIVLQYIPLSALKKIDAGDVFQEYIKVHAVNGALSANDYATALNLLRAGYPIVSTLDERGFNPLLYAVTQGYTKVALECIARFSSEELGIKSKEGMNALLIVCKNWTSDAEREKYYKVAHELLTKMNHQDILYRGPENKSAWDYATMSHDTELLVLMRQYVQGKMVLAPQQLINRLQEFAPTGVWTSNLITQAREFLGMIQDLGTKDENGNTALMLAIQQKRIMIARLLVKHISFEALVTVNRQDQSALDLAAQWKRKDNLVKDLIENIKKRIASEERYYFYDGIEATCSECVYIPTLDKKAGIISAATCIKNGKGDQSKSQELYIKPKSYVYNGGGRIVSAAHKVAGVFYVARRVDQVFGVKDNKEALYYGYQNMLPYTTATVAMMFSDQELYAIDQQISIRQFVSKYGYFQAARYNDDALVRGLINNHYDPNVISEYNQNPAMTAFQYGHVDIGKKLFSMIIPTSYGQQDNLGNTLLMYVANHNQKEIAKKLIEYMSPADLVKVNKKGETAYGLLVKAKWLDLINVLQKKAANATLFYTTCSAFTYVPNDQGDGGVYTESDNGMSVKIPKPNQLVCNLPSGGLGTITISQNAQGIPLINPTDMFRYNIDFSAIKSYSTMLSITVSATGPQSSAQTVPSAGQSQNNNW